MARRGPLSAAKRKREADKRAKRKAKEEKRALRSEEKARAKEAAEAGTTGLEAEGQPDRESDEGIEPTPALVDRPDA